MKNDINKIEDDKMKMEDDIDASWHGTSSDQDDFHELTLSFALDHPPCTPTFGLVTNLHQTPGKQEGEIKLSEGLRLGLLSTTIQDGLVGDQLGSTMNDDNGPKIKGIVEHTPFVFEEESRTVRDKERRRATSPQTG